MKRKINEWIDLDHAVSGGAPSAGRVHLLVGVPDPVDVFMSLISCRYLCDKVTILNIVFRPMTWRCCLLYVRLRPVGDVHTQLTENRISQSSEVEIMAFCASCDPLIAVNSEIAYHLPF
jgi:hypothetical protein